MRRLDADLRADHLAVRCARLDCLCRRSVETNSCWILHFAQNDKPDSKQVLEQSAGDDADGARRHGASSHNVNGSVSTAPTISAELKVPSRERAIFAPMPAISASSSSVSFWTMVLKAKSLNGGKEIRVIGNSHFRFDPGTGLALYHRDYFDMGEFIYERIPVVGGLIRFIKGKFAQSSE